jgi:hypothetical protein
LDCLKKTRRIFAIVSTASMSDSRIIESLETSPSMVYRTRKQLVEDGFEAVLSRKPRPMPAIARIFGGDKEAELTALACSKPPKGRRRTRHRRSRQRQHGRARAEKTLFSPICPIVASTGSSRRWPTAHS